MRFFGKTNIQFIKVRKIAYIISLSLITLSIVSLILHGGPRYNIDFTGGTLVQLKFEKPIEIQKVRSAIAEHGFGDAEIKHFGAPNEVVIRVGIVESDEEVATVIEKSITEKIPENPYIVERVEKVGPKIGHELVLDAIKAILWSMILILIYIMWRFEFKYSIGAIAALAHDITITLGVFSLFDIEISAPIIAALLTIVGYSLNDTIVVYDRIRENLKSIKRGSKEMPTIINRSINETLSRTVVTSGTTLMVVVVLYFFGGEVLRTFAFALIVGIGIGTYSSIFVASPILVDWKWHKA
ncbi:protein translocase subunit SecF [Caldithrix abyssi]|uniref:Protein-export membrane protein SecF n=1 Tax=Caldithrix abyssi DSM 13497 TaxID=880073 RepID=H1XWZ3_CALAY|nr:protein translocase subunit SecF [Caldithrix abyssi]APF19547.1 secF protein translocase subunit secF [Caldithrix abyssi DSM 13497]EHO39680.1 protein-export membrane protein SecF [Caldithrix abyssi DSM 13497]